MASRPDNPLLQLIRRLAAGRAEHDATDSDLLARFADDRDEEAFEALVRRHGQAVYGICRRVLSDTHDAEDAFQATFLILARKAASIRRREAVSSWLCGVAYRVARRALAEAAGRRARESPLAEVAAQEATAGVEECSLVLEEEIQRLLDGGPGVIVTPGCAARPWAVICNAFGVQSITRWRTGVHGDLGSRPLSAAARRSAGFRCRV
jgi:hypothetical protein